MLRFNLSFILVFSLLVFNCGISKPDLFSTYKSYGFQTIPSYEYHFVADNNLQLSIEIPTEYLEYEWIKDSNSFVCQLWIDLQIENPENKKNPTRQMVITVNDTNSKTRNPIHFKTNLVLSKDSTYTIQAKLKSATKDWLHARYFTIIKNPSVTTSIFLTTINNEPLLDRHLPVGSQVVLNTPNTTKSLSATYVELAKIFPEPPFVSIYEHQVQQIRSVFLDKMAVQNKKASFTLDKEGLFMFYEDTLPQHKYIIYSCGKNFPQILSANNMISPLRYITTNEEFDKIIHSDNPKYEADVFWLEIAQNPDRAKSLIKQYYNRVEYANANFSSHFEGWMTDRGMIYIVYGEPELTYKTSKTEYWVYGKSETKPLLEFKFNLFESPYSDNNFLLERSASYKTSWMKAVDLWRQGLVINY